MGRVGFLIVLLGIYLVVDWYAFTGLRQLNLDNRWFRWGYWIVDVILLTGIIFIFQVWQEQNGVRRPIHNWIFGFWFSLFVFKLALSLLLLSQDSVRLVVGAFEYVRNWFNGTSPDQFVPSRRKAITSAMTVAAGIPFLSLIYAISKGKYQYQIKNITLEFDDLPKAFDGFKIVQISDIHSGSYDSVEQVQKGVDLVNSLDGDMVVFTGDLVNSNKDEIDPFIDTFSSIKSKFGKFSITGNHDYYGRPKDEYQLKTYWASFQDKHRQMGFRLLMDEHNEIQKDGESIQLVGVENWGNGPFPKVGDLDRALTNVPQDTFTVLLSHDPTHWEEKVINHNHKIHVTLSGHTHGMQFGIAALGLKWSPIKYRYKRWMGLYEENDRKLYVNRGFGFLGFPGRVGMWPEITSIELKRKV